MKKIIMSLAMIAAVGAVVVGATGALFSDTEVSTGNTFTAGTIDIAVDGENPWVRSYHIGDLKPCETGYINFDIQNVGMNPVNVSKELFNFTHQDMGEDYYCDAVNGDVSSEPECAAEAGGRIDNVETQIHYDLHVEVYDDEENLIWWQEIFNVDEKKSLADVYGAFGSEAGSVALGMIPVGGHMEVSQSYHFNCDAGNEYQGDGLMFDMKIYGEQLTGEDGMASVVLENKRIGEPEWDIIQDDIMGTLSYRTSGAEFEYQFNAKAPLPGHDYVLAVGYDEDTDVDVKIGEGSTDASGYIEINGSVITGDLSDAKAWLIPAEYWVGEEVVWSSWPGMVDDFLWETGLINYVQN